VGLAGPGGSPPGSTFRAFLDYPSIDVFTVQENTIGSVFGFILYFAQALAFIAVFFVIIKMATFWSFEGIKFSFAQIVLSLLFLSTFINLFQLLWGPTFGSHVLTVSPAVFFLTHYVPYWFSAVTVFAFYFVEVSTLTSNKLDGLSKFAIPAGIVCAALWIIEVVVASIFCTLPDSIPKFTTIIQLYASIYIICGNLVMILLIVSATMLIISLASSNMKGAIVRFGLTAFGLCCCIQFQIVFAYLTCSSLRSVSPQWGEFGATMAGLAGMWWSPSFAAIMLALNYRVSLQKEIEISKSGTTSGSSSGRSGSSSSSSSNTNPVIEL